MQGFKQNVNGISLFGLRGTMKAMGIAPPSRLRKQNKNKKEKKERMDTHLCVERSNYDSACHNP